MATTTSFRRKLIGAATGTVAVAAFVGGPAGGSTLGMDATDDTVVVEDAATDEVLEPSDDETAPSTNFGEPADMGTRVSVPVIGSMPVNADALAQSTINGSLIIPQTTNEVRVLTQEGAQSEMQDLSEYQINYEDVANGRLPDDAMCKLTWTNKSVVRCDAAHAFELLDLAFKAEFGEDIDITDSYRSYEKQVEVRQQLGNTAAVPGYSNHGNGIALDLGSGIADASSAQNEWMREHASEYGWFNPDWAGGESREDVKDKPVRKVEPWHWEFHGVEGLTPTPVLA